MGQVSQPGGSVSSLKTDGLATWDDRDAAVGELVRPLVSGVAGVALDPAPGDRVPGQLGLQQPPQVGVLDRLLGGGDPAVLLPAGQPPRDPVHHVCRVHVQGHLALPGEGPEPFDDRGELHPVVRREHLAAEQLALMAAPAQPRAPAARAGVALARADAVDMWTASARAEPSPAPSEAGSLTATGRAPEGPPARRPAPRRRRCRRAPPPTRPEPSPGPARS